MRYLCDIFLFLLFQKFSDQQVLIQSLKFKSYYYLERTEDGEYDQV